jgi:hypothetical protein
MHKKIAVSRDPRPTARAPCQPASAWWAIAKMLLFADSSPSPVPIHSKSPPQQCEHTFHVILPELNKLDPQNPLRAFAAPLARLAQNALLALDARAKAKTQRSAASSDVDEWKEGVNALRVTAHAELLKVAAEKGLPRSWVDSFFQSEPAQNEDAIVDRDRATPPRPSAS